MFPLSLLQSSHSPLCTSCYEPTLTLWPAASRFIFGQLEDDMRDMRNDLERRMQRVNQAYQLLDMDMRRRAAQSRRPEGESSSEKKEGKENYELTLDISGFSPEELTVKTEGRRLIVSGKRDKKKEDEYGGYFHEYREWRREAELPEDVNPEDVLCSLSNDGHLNFQAPRRALPPAKERPIPITVTQNPVEGQQNPPEIQNSPPNAEQKEGPSSS